MILSYYPSCLPTRTHLQRHCAKRASTVQNTTPEIVVLRESVALAGWRWTQDFQSLRSGCVVTARLFTARMAVVGGRRCACDSQTSRFLNLSMPTATAEIEPVDLENAKQIKLLYRKYFGTPRHPIRQDRESLCAVSQTFFRRSRLSVIE